MFAHGHAQTGWQECAPGADHKRSDSGAVRRSFRVQPAIHQRLGARPAQSNGGHVVRARAGFGYNPGSAFEALSFCGARMTVRFLRTASQGVSAVFSMSLRQKQTCRLNANMFGKPTLSATLKPSMPRGTACGPRRRAAHSTAPHPTSRADRRNGGLCIVRSRTS